MPRITVVADIAEPVYEHGLSIAELGRLKSTVQTAASHLLGLTRQLFKSGAQTAKSRILTQENGSVCVGFTDGTIMLEMKTMIFVVSELAPDSCLYGQVLAHEQRHASVGRRLFAEFAAKLEAGIADALQKAPFVKVTDEAAAPAAAKARMSEIFDPLYRDFRSTYRKRQAIIDTSGEYDRVRAACPGEHETLVRE